MNLGHGGCSPFFQVWAFGRHESGQLGIGEGSKYKFPEPRLVKELSRE